MELSNDTCLRGRPVLSTSVALAALLALPAAGWSQVRTEEVKIAPSALRPYDLFGSSVALDGNRLLVGLWGEPDPLSGFPQDDRPGRVRLHDATTGQPFGVLTASDHRPDDGFGMALAADGGLGLVGSPLSDGVVGSTGAAYVIDSQSGQELRKLTAADGDPGDLFGASVDLHGTQAIVGAQYDSDVALLAGSAYLFDAGTGQQRFKLQAPVAVPDSWFGASVAIEGPLAVVGAPGITSGGEVHVFDTATGQALLQLTPATPVATETFGSAVALHGTLVLVGAPLVQGALPPTSNTGSVYVFDGLTGQQLAVLQPGAPSGALRFGGALAVHGGQVAVSAIGSNVSGYYTGSVHVFDIASGQFVTELVSSDAPTAVFNAQPFVVGTNGFGRSVAYDGGRVAVGAYVDSQSARYAGAVYTFLDTPLNTGQGHCHADGTQGACACGFDSPSSGCANSATPGALLYGTGDAALGNDSLVLRVANLPAGVPGSFVQGVSQPGVVAGAGVLCTSGLLRYPVQLSSGTGKVELSGLAAQASPGATLSYQFWYRDVGGCGASGFNLSNAWTVTW